MLNLTFLFLFFVLCALLQFQQETVLYLQHHFCMNTSSLRRLLGRRESRPLPKRLRVLGEKETEKDEKMRAILSGASSSQSSLRLARLNPFQPRRDPPPQHESTPSQRFISSGLPLTEID